jgi:hypothetical protein
LQGASQFVSRCAAFGIARLAFTLQERRPLVKMTDALPLVSVLVCVAIPGAAAAAEAPASPATKAAQTTQIERGRYLVAIMGCNDRHTQDFHARGDFKIPENDRLTGSNLGWRGPWGTTYPNNSACTSNQ